MINKKDRSDDYSQIRISIDNLLKENDKTKRGLASHLEIAESNLNRKLNNRITIDDLEKIALYIGCSIIDILTQNTAGRDNNINNGDNKGVVGNSGTIGNMVSENSGNYVVMGEQKAKKIMKDGEVTIEMEQSAEIELLRQTNTHLETRIKDLEMINASQSKTIETMQLLIDTLRNK